MFNIERELELVVPDRSDYTFGRILYVNDQQIKVMVQRNGRDWDEFNFCHKTGVMLGYQDHDNGAWRLREKSAMRPIDHYFLHVGQREWSKGDWIKITIEDHPDGQTAAARMKDYNQKASETQSPFRFIIKKEVELSPIRDYPKWAAERFETGEWVPVPWTNEPWAQHPFHFAHVARGDDAQVAFWYSEGDAQRDYVRVMAPGRYLQEYFSDHLTPNEIRDWAVKLDAEAELKFATTADEMYHVYANGPESCMAYKEETSWSGTGRVNPIRVYAAGDLAVAYLERKGKIVARALCWPAKKAVGRIYGDIERMKDIFAGEGWSFDCDKHSAGHEGSGLFDGARILKMVPPDHPKNFIAPYLDFSYLLQVTGDEDEFHYLTQGRDDDVYPSCRTDGLLWEPGYEHSCDDDDDDDDDRGTCERCGDSEDSDDLFTVGDQTWCYSCRDDHSSICTTCGDRFDDNYVTTTEDGDAYCSRHNHVVSSCDYCGDSHHMENLRAVYDGRDEDSVHADACSHCIDHDSTIVVMPSGVIVDSSTVSHCEVCEEYHSNNLDECPCVEARAEEELEPAE